MHSFNLKPNLSDLLIFKGLLNPVPTQEIFFKPFVGMEIEFIDGISFIHDTVIDDFKIIGVIPIHNGFRSVFYRHKFQ